MKLLNTEVTPFTAAAFPGVSADLINGKVVYFNGDEMQKGEYHLTLKNEQLKFKSMGDAVEPFEHNLDFQENDERRVHYRALEIDGQKFFSLWMAPWGEAHGVLQSLRAALHSLDQGHVQHLRIEVTDAAILSGFVVSEDDNAVQLVQIPTWKTPKDQIVGRTTMLIDDVLTTGQDEIFFNNLWLTFPKLSAKYDVFWDAENNAIVLSSQATAGEDSKSVGMGMVVTLPAMEEVNYNSPAMAKLGLVKDAPELTQVYSDETGRSVQFIKEDLGNAVYHSYVLGHGPSGLADQITLGSEAVHNEQLVAVLKHRYQTLQDAIPHEANVRTLELLDEIIVLQASRYKQREEEGILGTTSPGSAVTASNEDTHAKPEVSEDNCTDCDDCSSPAE